MSDRKPPRTPATDRVGVKLRRPPGWHGATRANGRKVTVLDAPVEAGSSDSAATVLAFPEPVRRKRRRRWVLGLSLLTVVVAGLLAYLVFSPALALRTLSVEGNTLVPADEIMDALNPLMGTSLTRISDDQVSDLLSGFAPIEAVTVAAVPPSTLAVTIREREPVAILSSDDRFLLIDSQGRQLTSVENRNSVDLPLIDGGTEAVNSDVFSSITSVLSSLPQNILSRLEHASAESVDSVELSLTNGKTVFWGSSEDNGTKATVLEALLGARPSKPEVEVYDVSAPTRPVTR